MFKQRLLHQIQTSYRYWKSLIDWVTLFYLTVPTSIFCFYFVRETILKGEYGLLNDVGSGVIVLAMVASTGLFQHRYLIDFADKLFFIQHTHAFNRVKLLAFLFSFVKNLILLSITYVLMLPYFTVVKGFADWQVVQLAMVLIIALLLSELSRYIYKKWKKIFVIVCVIPVLVYSVYTSPFIIIWSSILLVSAIIIMVKRFILSTRYFEKQAQLEFEASTQIQMMMIKMNPQFAQLKNDVFARKRPMLLKMLYAKSDVGAIVELALKTIWRRKKYTLRVLQLTGIIAGLLVLFPKWAIILLLIIFYIAIKQFAESVVYEVKESPFGALFAIHKDVWEKGYKKLSRILLIPSTVLFLGIIIVRLL